MIILKMEIKLVKIEGLELWSGEVRGNGKLLGSVQTWSESHCEIITKQLLRDKRIQLRSEAKKQGYNID